MVQKRRKMKAIFAVLFSLLSVVAFSQTKQDVAKAYNAGAGLMKTNPQAAIDSLQKGIEIASQVGSEADEYKQMAEGLLPDSYYQLGIKKYKSKDLEGAAEAFQKAADAGAKYGDADVKSKAEKIIPQLYFAVGNNEYKNKNYDAAIASFEKAIAINPNYDKAYFGEFLVYRAQENTDKLIEAADKTIETSKATNDNAILNKVQSTARDYLVVAAAKFKDKNELDKALELTKKALEYDPEYKEAHYLLATIYNKQSKWDEAIASANEALKYENGGAEAKARIYYELGTAYAGKGENSAACDAFKKAAVGNYAQSANYQIKNVLKCQ